jgi:hypothetical protein
MSELKDILSNKEMKAVKETTEKPQKPVDKNQKPEKLSLHLDT